MLRRHRLIIQRSLMYVDAGLLLISYALAGKLRFLLAVDPKKFHAAYQLHLGLVGTALIGCLLGYKLAGLYRSQRMSGMLNEAGKVVLVNILVFLVMLAAYIFAVAAFAPVRDYKESNVWQIILFAVVNTLLVVGVRAGIRTLAHNARRKGYNYRNLLILAQPERDPEAILQKVADHGEWGFRVLGIVPMPGDGSEKTSRIEEFAASQSLDVIPIEEAADFIDREPVDEVWVDGLPNEKPAIADFVFACAEQGVNLRYILQRNFFPGVRWGFETFDTITTLSASKMPMDDIARVIKRGIDVAVASVVLVLASPVMLLVSLFLILERQGGVLFRQQRVGLNGRLFDCYKYRTMVADAEKKRQELEKYNEMGGPVFKMKRDPRITWLGRWLRKFSIDELPQLFNVLKGDMSLVGPRPPIPSEVNQYARAHKRRLSVKPGITGLWQVSGRNEIADFDEWVKLDLEYIDHWSLMLDLKIMLRTIPAVFFAKGAR